MGKSNKNEILYGIHPVWEALIANRRTFHEIFICQGKNNHRINKVAAAAEKQRIPLRQIPRNKFTSIAGNESHQGIAATVTTYPTVSLNDIIGYHDRLKKPALYLLLDNVLDPHNLGAIIRTALCIDISGVVIPKDRSATPTPGVSKYSAGALEHIKLAQVVNMTNAIKELKRNNVWIMGLDKSGKRSIYDYDFTMETAIVIGGEESGIRPLVKKHCDFMGFIPQTGPVSSLNASVAAAITIYEAYRQRDHGIKTTKNR